MTEDKPKGRVKSLLRSASSLFRRSKKEESVDLLRAESYLVGDIREERPVLIEPGAMIAGNVVAPRVAVAGLVYGSVTAREVTIEVSGQIWGDVYTAALEMRPGGKMNGWLTTLNEGTVDLLRAGEISLVDLPGITPPGLESGEMETLLAAGTFDPEISGHWLPVWRQLQAEAAVALLARAEIEASFEERLREALEVELGSDVTGDTAMVAVQARLTAKEAEVQILQRDLADARVQLALALEQMDRLQEQLPPGTAAAQIDNVSLTQETPVPADMKQADDAPASIMSLSGGEDSASELDLCLNQLRARSERVSGLTVALVERELELAQARRLAEKRLQQLEQVKVLASKRIRQLDAEINRLRTGE